MGSIERTKIEPGPFLEDKELQEHFHIEAYWLPLLPQVSGTMERYDAAIASSRPYDGNGQGHLVIASPSFKDDRHEMLLFSFPVDELYAISIVHMRNRPDALQIQSVQKGTLVGGYREFTVSESGMASTRVGYFRAKTNDYHL